MRILLHSFRVSFHIYGHRGYSSGLGFETVRQLYLHNAKVYLACRSEEKGTDAIARIKTEDTRGGEEKKGELVWLKCDFTDPRDAKKAAEEFLGKEEKLDVLGEFAFLRSSLHNDLCKR